MGLGRTASNCLGNRTPARSSIFLEQPSPPKLLNYVDGDQYSECIRIVVQVLTVGCRNSGCSRFWGLCLGIRCTAILAYYTRFQAKRVLRVSVTTKLTASQLASNSAYPKSQHCSVVNWCKTDDNIQQKIAPRCQFQT